MGRDKSVAKHGQRYLPTSILVRNTVAGATDTTRIRVFSPGQAGHSPLLLFILQSIHLLPHWLIALNHCFKHLVNRSVLKT